MAQESCGGIWKRKKKDGEVFLSIDINGQKYVAWKNDKGDNDKRPDFKVYPSAPMPDRTQETPRTSPPNKAVAAVKDAFDGEEIPF